MNDKVYWYVGWKLRRVEGEIKGYVANLFGDTKAVILITKSESNNYWYRVGDYVAVKLDLIRNTA